VMRTNVEILQGMEIPLFLNMCMFDFKFFAERVFGYQVKPFHIEFMKLAHSNRFNVIKSFRGSGKTTFLGIVYPIWLCLFKPNAYILYTASELSQAVKILDEVKETIENNEFLKDLMPSNPSTWKKTELKLDNGCRLYAKAFTVHIKGLHVDYAFVDEVQDCNDRSVYNKGIAPTVNQKQGHLVSVGTPDNPGDMLEELSHRPEYVSRVFPVLVRPGVSRWPEKFSIEELERIRKRDGEHSFQTQYMMNCNVNVDGSAFPTDWITNCFCYNERFQDRPVAMTDSSSFILGADFAISKGIRADFDSYVVVEKIGNKTFLRWGERHKGFSKDAKVARIVELYARYNFRRMVLDPSGIGEAVVQELRAKGLPVEVAEFHSRARNKLLVNLIMMIQPEERTGESQLIIPRDPTDELTMTFTNKLVEELLSFKETKSESTGVSSLISKGSHDDTVMSLAMACKAAAETREFVDIIGI